MVHFISFLLPHDSFCRRVFLPVLSYHGHGRTAPTGTQAMSGSGMPSPAMASSSPSHGRAASSSSPATTAPPKATTSLPGPWRAFPVHGSSSPEVALVRESSPNPAVVRPHWFMTRPHNPASSSALATRPYPAHPSQCKHRPPGPTPLAPS